jgi:hypothetical protein
VEEIKDFLFSLKDLWEHKYFLFIQIENLEDRHCKYAQNFFGHEFLDFVEAYFHFHIEIGNY